MPHQSHVSHGPLRVVLGAVACAALVVGVLATRALPSALSSATPGRGDLSLAASDLPFTMLCQGFSDCGNKGYSDAGYGLKSNYNTMYWNMYSGSNCVNYVAYRMIKGGMSSQRPSQLKPGKGNAEYWGTSFPNITNRTPSVGAVAWWKGGATGAGSEGHVAYVEKVVAPDDIIISESNWGSPFDWREITGPTDWPTGFIHFADQQVTPVVAPAIVGTPQVGKTLKASPGTWSPHPKKLTYTWKIAGTVVGTGRTFVPPPTAKNQKVALAVTAAATHYTSRTVTVAAATRTARGVFATTTPPGIAGTAQASRTLTLKQARFGPTPHSLNVQWLADGQPIQGATAATFTPTVDQIGQQITAEVIARNTGYVPMTVTTTATPAVLGLPLRATGGAVAGVVTRNGALTLDPGTFNTDGITPTIQWIRDGVAIPGATNATYHPTTADVGHRLAVVVSAAKYQYADYTKTYTEGIVTTQGLLSISAVGKDRSVRVHVRMSAPGMGTDALNRVVTVSIGAAKSARLLLHDGVGTVVLPDVNPGIRKVRVTWAGSRLIEASRLGVATRVYSQQQWAQRRATNADTKPSKASSVTESSSSSTGTTPSSSPSTKPSTTPSTKASTTASSKPSTKATTKASTKATTKATTKASSSATTKPTSKASTTKK